MHANNSGRPDCSVRHLAHFKSLSIMKVTTPRKGTSLRTLRLRRRVQELARVREVVSGGSPEDLLEKEIKHLTVAQRAELLSKAGIKTQIPPEQGLAMKTGMAR